MACTDPYNVKLAEPILIGNRSVFHIDVNCGKCPHCIWVHQNSWGFRLHQEIKRSWCGYFVTLTYSSFQDTLSFSKRGQLQLDKNHVQNFFKRLRYYTKSYESIAKKKTRAGSLLVNAPIRYFLTGEYGEMKGRPHYHAIIFNAPVPAIKKSWCNKDGTPIGNVDIGNVCRATIWYTFKYLNKNAYGVKDYSGERTKPFRLFSKNLGRNYLFNDDGSKKGYMFKFHRSRPENNFVSLGSGYKLPMPRYYFKELYRKDPIRNYISGESSTDKSLINLKKFITLHKESFINDDPDGSKRIANKMVIWNRFRAKNRLFVSKF